MDRRAQLNQKLAVIGAMDDEEFPLGKSQSRREVIIRAAVEAADELIMEGSDGSCEETNYLTGEVALKLLEKTIQPLRSAILRKDIESRRYLQNINDR